MPIKSFQYPYLLGLHEQLLRLDQLELQRFRQHHLNRNTVPPVE